jgi:hypothetical protein
MGGITSEAGVGDYFFEKMISDTVDLERIQQHQLCRVWIEVLRPLDELVRMPPEMMA